jgi:ABC-type nitrate/sulfonate/bicarbonate transport system substrate-binding protein
VGFIPLADATALIVAVDKGFTAEEGLDVELVRDVSWSNVRDRLNIGQFDAAHLLAPVAIASNLGLGHVRVPITAPFNLGLNGNAITVTNALFAALKGEADGDLADPRVSAAALARVVAARKRKGAGPLTFGMTFPYSTHNYQLRFWMASGGVDPDQDIRLVVLPPPFMVESIANGHVDAFCVGAPWNSVAVDLGLAHILHFVSEILQRAAEKVLAVRSDWASQNPDVLMRLIRAHGRAADFVEDVENREEVSRILSAPNRIGVAPEVIRRTLGRPPQGGARRHLPLERSLPDGWPQGCGAPRPGAGRLAVRADGTLGSGADVVRAARDGDRHIPPRSLRCGARPCRRAGAWRAGRWCRRLCRSRVRRPQHHRASGALVDQAQLALSAWLWVPDISLREIPG